VAIEFSFQPWQSSILFLNERPVKADAEGKCSLVAPAVIE
jgi:hypothetical protein